MELLFPDARGRLRIHKDRTGESFDVMPGQVLNFTSGQLLESYQFRAQLDSIAASDAEVADEAVSEEAEAEAAEIDPDRIQ